MRDDSDDFDIDSFEVDDSFLREVDDITARAVAKPVRSVSLAAGNGTPAKAWTGPQRSVSSASVFPPSSKAGASTAFRAPQVGSTRPPPRGVRSLVPSTRPTIAPRTGAPTPAQPYSDDYDSLAPPLPTKSLVALDSDVRPCWPTVIPSSRLVRTSSGSSGFLQIHLNFRKENQATKGKRWDRTVSAERRGRIWSNKAKMSGTGKGKRGWDDDENDSEEGDDWGVPLAPYPKPLVDPSKFCRFLGVAILSK
jgi:ATP-dependent DNA helicase MPH1